MTIYSWIQRTGIRIELLACWYVCIYLLHPRLAHIFINCSAKSNGDGIYLPSHAQRAHLTTKPQFARWNNGLECISTSDVHWTGITSFDSIQREIFATQHVWSHHINMARIWNVNNKIQLDSYLSKVRAKRWMWLHACVFVLKIFVSPARSFVVTKHHHHRRLSIECAMNERFVLRVYLKTTKRESK